MNDQTETTGSCLCGAVTITAKSVYTRAGACHCNSCRKWSGGPFLSVDCGTSVELGNAQDITVYASSDWAERGFCSKCGSNLFYRLKQSGQYIVPAGILDIEDKLLFDHQIFIDQKPGYYEFSNKTKNMTGAEVFAQYSAE